MDLSQYLTMIIPAGSFIASFAALTAGIIMLSVTKKFGSGILATGFRTISIGVLFIAAGIIVDTVNSYIQISNSTISVMIILVKYLLFVIGTYIIVIGSKNTGDKLENLTK